MIELDENGITKQWGTVDDKHLGAWWEAQ